MRKLIIYLSLMISFSSCFKVYESVSNLLTKDRVCWIDTRKMIFYYNGKAVMTGISIHLRDEKRSIEYESNPGYGSIQEIHLMEIKETLVKQSIGIYVSRDSVHWRDGISFDIDPSDWKKKKIVSTHTYH